MKWKCFFSVSSQHCLLFLGNNALSERYYVNILQLAEAWVFTVINSTNRGNVEKWAFNEVVCNFRKNMNETVDNYV